MIIGIQIKHVHDLRENILPQTSNNHENAH